MSSLSDRIEPASAPSRATLRDFAATSGMSAEAAEALAAIDATVTRIRRGMVRRDFGRVILHELDPGLDLVHMDAMAAAAPGEVGCSAPSGEVTVGLVAEQLSVDPSRASRVVSDLVERGYLLRVASQADARRTGLMPTERGVALLRAFRLSKWQAMVRVLGSWREDELIVFAGLIERFSTWTHEALRRD
jgi:DNA-binding MarR family transcriptional regulator